MRGGSMKLKLCHSNLRGSGPLWVAQTSTMDLNLWKETDPTWFRPLPAMLEVVEVKVSLNFGSTSRILAGFSIVIYKGIPTLAPRPPLCGGVSVGSRLRIISNFFEQRSRSILWVKTAQNVLGPLRFEWRNLNLIDPPPREGFSITLFIINKI